MVPFDSVVSVPQSIPVKLMEFSYFQCQICLDIIHCKLAKMYFFKNVLYVTSSLFCKVVIISMYKMNMLEVILAVQ